MTNTTKLILVVLTFFLALTFVRGLDVTNAPREVTLIQGQAIPYTFSLTNTTGHSITPQFLADGPFTIELHAPADDYAIPGNYTRSHTLHLRPLPEFEVGDVYNARIRVGGDTEQVAVPLTLKVKPAPLFSGNGSPSTGVDLTGLASFVGTNFEKGINVGLIVLVGILVIAFIARIRNRLGGE